MSYGFYSINEITICEKIKKISTVSNLRQKVNTNGKFYVNLSQISGNVYTNVEDRMVKDDFYTVIVKGREVESEPKMQYFGFEKENEANNFLSYVKTNFARFCLSIYKSNKNAHRGELEIIPWLDFTQEWTDGKLIKEFKLSMEEVKFINKNIPSYY